MAPHAMSDVQRPAPTPTVEKTEKSGKSKTPLELISQGACLPGIPRHPTFATHRQWLLERMALAFRSFARKGYTDGMAGHISVRDPENPHTFWTVSSSVYERQCQSKLNGCQNPLARHFALLKASDMILVDYAGKPIGGRVSSVIVRSVTDPKYRQHEPASELSWLFHPRCCP